MALFLCDTRLNLDDSNLDDSNLDDSGITLSTFSSRDNLKLHNIHITPKVITNLDLSKTSGPVCIPLREKCPNTEFFLVRIFLYSD